MKTVTSVEANTRKRAFEVGIEESGKMEFPFGQCCPPPTPSDPIECLFIDPEVGRTGFSYRLRSGADGIVLSDHVLRYNRDPDYMLNEILYELSCEAKDRFTSGSVGVRALARRLKTSPAQLYRLLDQTFYGKSVDQMFKLLAALGAEVKVEVR